jgi:hypothetical protein
MKGTGYPSKYVTRKETTLSPGTCRRTAYKYATTVHSNSVVYSQYSVDAQGARAHMMSTTVALVTSAVDLSSAVQMAELSQQVGPEWLYSPMCVSYFHM